MITLFLGTATGVGSTAVVAKNMSEDGQKPTIILVHGAFADGSSWNKVIPLLQQKGFATIAVQNPLTSLQEDVTFTKRAIDRAQGPVVLVGHSWGGAVITEAGTDKKVKSLVYVSAFAPDTAEHLHDILEEYHGVHKVAKVPGFTNPILDSHGFFELREQTILDYFAPDIPKAEAKLIAASQGKLHKDVLDQRITVAAWKTKPSWFIVSSKDQMIAPDVMRGMARRINAQTTEIATSHVPMLVQPEEVTRVIIEAAMAE